MLGEIAIAEHGDRKPPMTPIKVSGARTGLCQKEIRASRAIGIRQEEAAYLEVAGPNGFLGAAEAAQVAVMVIKEMVMEVRHIEEMADQDHPTDEVPRTEEMVHLEEAGRLEADRRVGIGPLTAIGPQVGMDLQEEGLAQEVVAWRI